MVACAAVLHALELTTTGPSAWDKWDAWDKLFAWKWRRHVGGWRKLRANRNRSEFHLHLSRR